MKKSVPDTSAGAKIDERIKQLGTLVAHTAEDLTHRLGGKWPHGR